MIHDSWDLIFIAPLFLKKPSSKDGKKAGTPFNACFGHAFWYQSTCLGKFSTNITSLWWEQNPTQCHAKVVFGDSRVVPRFRWRSVPNHFFWVIYQWKMETIGSLLNSIILDLYVARRSTSNPTPSVLLPWKFRRFLLEIGTMSICIPCNSKSYQFNGLSEKTIILVGIYNQQFQGIMYHFDGLWLTGINTLEVQRPFEK